MSSIHRPTTDAPTSATRSPITVSATSITIIAITRGTTRKRIGSIASARRPSSCSVTVIVASSAVLFAPTRPENMSAIRIGPISRSTA